MSSDKKKVAIVTNLDPCELFIFLDEKFSNLGVPWKKEGGSLFSLKTSDFNICSFNPIDRSLICAGLGL